MKNIRLVIEYDGKDFNGWQKQPNKLNIQGTIEQAINKITGEEVELNASGRTDAGVHSLGQVANFKTNYDLPMEKWPLALNANLKKSIVIKSAEEVDERFHSRLSCKRKTYRYVINNSKYGTAIYRNLETHIPQKLDIEKMQEAAKYFEGEHDFKAFKASGTSGKSSVRKIYKAEVLPKEDERIYIELTGNGFLYNMVRIISGTLVDVGLGKIKPDEIPQIINDKEREKAGKTLPPHGLYLVKVEYE
ncbi:MAG: tRNA pseudouridine(38-40) synthase TruA [Clostridia bacterium]|nr:tRNA pseudouridine(38-40) synthase TruA [Clostridia bacterium]